MLRVQVALAGSMPAPVFLAAAATTIVAAALTLSRVSGRVKERSEGAGEESWSVWRVWQLVAGTVGFAIIPQVCREAGGGRQGDYPSCVYLL